MTTVKVKKRLMYATYSFIFLFGGIEYAVILPTLWLYLSEKYDSPEYMLGLVLSAYSVAAFFSAPFFGRISDRWRRTRLIFLICLLFEMGGSFLYFIGISQWLCVASRFISGLGAASEGVALAEVSRYTSEEERTRIISYLVAMRQIALLMGPALNLFLRLANFYIGPWAVTKYSAPGIFMVCMWLLLMLVIVALYTEPKDIYYQEQQEAFISNSNMSTEGDEAQNQINGQAPDGIHSVYDSFNGNVAHRPRNDFLTSDDGAEITYPPILYEKSYGSQVYDDYDNSSEIYHEITYDEPTVSTKNGRIEGARSNTSCPSLPEVCGDRDGSYSDMQAGLEHVAERDTQEDPWCHNVDLSSSVEILTRAEEFINSSQWNLSEQLLAPPKNRTEQTTYQSTDLLFQDDHFSRVGTEDNLYNNGSRDDADEATALLGASRHRHEWAHRTGQTQISENDPYIQRNLTAIDDPIAQEGKLGFFCNEYIRDEIIAILCLFFCAMFSQVCLETMVLPLSKYYLDFGELENSFLYFFSGIEVIIVFLMLGRISRCVSDRILIIFGAVVLLLANGWLLYNLPNAPPHDRTANLPMFAVAVVLDMLSMPFLIVCATSLYSKLTRRQTQGLSQGLRRSIVGIGTIMGPLWGSSASTQPYLLLGVLVALQSFSLILCCLSFPRLKAQQNDNRNTPPVNTSENHQVVASPSNPAPTAVYESSESFVNSMESAEWALIRGGSCINSHIEDKTRFSTSTNSGSTPTTIIYGGDHPRAVSNTSNASTVYGSMPRSHTGSSFHSVLSYNSGRASGFASPLV